MIISSYSGKGCPRESGSTRSTPLLIVGRKLFSTMRYRSTEESAAFIGDISVGISPAICNGPTVTLAAPKPNVSPLLRNVATLWGVGPERATQWADWKSEQSKTSCCTGPRRYEDRRHFRAGGIGTWRSGNHSRQSAGAGRDGLSSTQNPFSNW